MKKLFSIMLLSFLLLSCEKEMDLNDIENYNGTWLCNNPSYASTLVIEAGKIKSFRWDASLYLDVPNGDVTFDSATGYYKQEMRSAGGTVSTSLFSYKLKDDNLLQVTIQLISKDKLITIPSWVQMQYGRL